MTEQTPGNLPPLVEMDCYDAIEIVAARPDAASAGAGAPAAEPAPDGWCCWPCARLARAAEPAPDRDAALAEAHRVITAAIGYADVLDMEGDDLYVHFGQIVLEDLIQRPDLLRALAGAGAPEPASDVQAARIRVAADMVRKALAYRLGVTGLCRLDTAADIGWLVETGRQIVTALDAAGVGAPEPAQDDEAGATP